MKIAELQKEGFVLKVGFISTVRKECRLVFILKKKTDHNNYKYITHTVCRKDQSLEKAEFTTPNILYDAVRV